MPKPSGQVYLCENALIDNSYTNTISFKDPSEQLSYWGSLVKYRISDFMYIRRTRQYIKVDKSLSELEGINYLYFRAEESGKIYYCFVTTKEYISDSATYLYFETDVLQTYMFDYEVKQSYVQQEHVDRWTADHKPIYSRTEEGLDYGSEYTVESAYRVKSAIKAPYFKEWYLVVMAEGYNVISGRSSEHSNIGTIANPYVFLLVPNSDSEGLTATVRNPADYTATEGVKVDRITEFLKITANSELGNFVKQIIRLPYLPFDFSVNGDPARNVDTTGKMTVNITYQVLGDSNDTAKQGVFLVIGNVEQSVKFTKQLASLGIFEGIDSALPTDEQWAEVKSKPYFIERDKRFESKLLCYPYRYNYLSDWKTQPAIIKNEYLTGDSIDLWFTQGICFNAPARYWIDGYRKDPEGRNNSVMQTEQEDVPILTDSYYTYMLQNRNQLQADRNNAIINASVGALSSAVGGAIGGAAAGGVVGAIGGAVTGIVGGAVNGAVNYQALVRSQNAKQSDLKNLPDTILSVNDCSFNSQDNNKYITLYRMKICCEFEELLADTFAMTGYTVKRVKVPNLRTRLRYNYVKTVGANIVGSFNQNDLRTIQAIFDNGVTFWHWNDVNFKPFDYSLENIERSLL